MRVLYITRDRSNLGWKPRLRSMLQAARTPFGQDGFFEAAMDAAFDVTRRPASQVLPELSRLSRRFDALIVNYKLGGDIQSRHVLLQRLGATDVPSILFYNVAKAGRIPGDDVLDRFDLVFKREHFRDLDRYAISNENKLKLRTTMLECSPRTVSLLERYRRVHDRDERSTYSYDVFFSGATTAAVRTEAWEAVTNSGLSFRGGLQLRELHGQNEKNYRAAKLPHRAYLKTLLASKINLALEGLGEFTFRHLEIWCAGSFMISTKSVRDLTLPLNAREGEHFVVFEDIQDLRDKLLYYARNDHERERIAKAGRTMFLRDYDPVKHGQQIRKAVEELC